MVDNLARGLAALGHQVVLFTVGESGCPVTRRRLYPSAVEPMGDSIHEAAHALAAYDALGDVDVIHDHTVLGPLLGPVARPDGPPRAVTYHGPFQAESRRILAAAAAHGTSVVAISHAQAASAGRVPVAAVIHHGIDLDAYRFGPGGGDYLLFVGRMSPDKGVARAVRIAHRAGFRIIIASKIRENEEHAYFEHAVRPLLRDSDEVRVEEPLTRRIELLRHAPALLDPIDWPEPFGLVMAEALACGTPVIGRPFGAAPEIVDDRVTGFLAFGDDELVAAVGRIDTIDRRGCRAAAEQRFALPRMARDYERLYRRLLRSADTWQHRPGSGPWSRGRGYDAPAAHASSGGSLHHAITTVAPVAGPVDRA